MTEPQDRKPAGTVVGWWLRFWFQPEPAYPLGLVRMAFGALSVAWAVSLLPDLYELFGNEGVAAHQTLNLYEWSVFNVWTSDRALLIGWAVLLLSAIALTVGWHSRLAAVIVFILVTSFERHDPWIFNSGDNLIRIEALFLALSSCGAALSFDQRRRTGSFWSAQIRAPWPLRLMQLQLSLVYLATVQFKMMGDSWPEGTAVSYALRLQDLQLLPTPDWITGNALLMNIATWGTVGIELALGILVWNRRLRPWVLAFGVVMHLMISATLAVAFFSFAMFVLYLAFVSPGTVKRMPDTVKRALTKPLAILPRPRRTNSSSGSPSNGGAVIEPQTDRELNSVPIAKAAENGYQRAQLIHEVDAHVHRSEPKGPADASTRS